MAYSGAYGMQRERRPAPDGGTPEGRPSESSSSVSRRTDRPQSGPPRGGLTGAMEALIKKLESINLEMDDLIMALILYLMYRESGDKDLLIMLGAMLLT